MSFSALIPHPEYVDQLLQECKILKIPIQNLENQFFLTTGKTQKLPCWAQQAWQNCERIQFQSISDAAQILKGKAKLWLPYSVSFHRRTNLIAEKIRYIKQKKIARRNLNRI